MNQEILFYSEHYLEFEPKSPIIIPSYKNREGTILSNLKSLSNNKIILFIYDTDYNLYKQYLDNPQIEIVQIKETWRSIQKKRHWIQNYLANERPEIETYIMVDDDIRKAKISCYKEDGKITSKYIPVINALGILEDLHKKYSNTVSGGAGVNTAILGEKLISKNKYTYQTFCFNNAWLKKHPQCMFRDMQNVSEDNVIWFDCYNNNQPYYAFECLYFEYNNQKVKTYNSIASTPLNRMKNDINALRIIKHNCKLHWSTEWNCWAVRFIPNYIQPMVQWENIKKILDLNIPNWENLENNYEDTVFKKTFNEINNYLKSRLIDNPNETEIDSWLC